MTRVILSAVFLVFAGFLSGCSAQLGLAQKMGDFGRIRSGILIKDQSGNVLNAVVARPTLKTGEVYTFDSSGSTSLDGKPLTFYWYAIRMNIGSFGNVELPDTFNERDFYLSGRSRSKADFVLKSNAFNENHYYEMHLIVSDGENTMDPSVGFKIANSTQSDISNFGEAPIINASRLMVDAGSDVTINVGSVYSPMDGSKIYHKDNKSFTKRWIQKTGKTDDNYEVPWSTTGNYLLELVCSDGTEVSVDTVNVVVQ